MSSMTRDGWPFLRQDGMANGMTKHQVDGPAYRQLFSSVRVPAHSDLTAEVLALAAVLVVPTAVISHQLAARLHGGVVPQETVAHVTVSTARQRRCRTGLFVHVGRNVATMRHGPLEVTTPAQTFCDLADHLGLVDLVILGDSMVHRGCLDLPLLLDAVEAMTTGSRAAARRAAELVRPGAESPMETRVRLMMFCAGLPEPAINMSISDSSGSATYRLDVSYPDLRLAIEYDGRQHAEDARQWGHDINRREWLDDHQWRLVVLRAADVFDTPWETILRLGAILATRGYDKPLPASAPTAFRLHFPGRPWTMARTK